MKKGALLFLMLFIGMVGMGAVLTFLPAAHGATALADIPKSTYLKYRCEAGQNYNLSIDMAFTDNSTTVYKVVFNGTAYMQASETFNGTAYIQMSNRTILVSYLTGDINLFPNGTESIFYIEPKLAKAATYNANFINSSVSGVSEGAFEVYRTNAKFVNVMMDKTFSKAIYSRNVTIGAQSTVNDTSYHLTDAVHEYYSGINLYQRISSWNNVTGWDLDVYLYSTNYSWYEAPAAEGTLNLTSLIYVILLVMLGAVVLTAAIRQK